MKPYERHVFVCEGKRCAARGSEALIDSFKAGIKDRGLASKARVSRSGCLNVCKETSVDGEFCPTAVVYPDGVWYKCLGPDDVDEIIREHLAEGRPVERLVLYRMKG